MGHHTRQRSSALSAKLLIPVVAIFATAFAGVVSPGAAAAAVVDPASPWSACGNPPDAPEATPENRDRFIELWLPRFQDNAWLQQFAGLDQVPENILAEGFHAMGGKTKGWLGSCLLDAMLAKKGETPTQAQITQYLMGINVIVFGKEQIAELREEANQTTPPVTKEPVHQDMTSDALEGMKEELLTEPSLTSGDLPKSDAPTPTVTTAKNLDFTGSPTAPAASVEPTPIKHLTDLVKLPLVPVVLDAVNAVMQLVSDIQGQLFTLPAVNLLSPLFYKVCAESPTMPLSCSASLPVGVPVPADVTGDNFPDVLVRLSPLTNLVDVGAVFYMQRLWPNIGALPAHVFAVYDTPVVKKRVQIGYDGRASTLGYTHRSTFKLKNAVSALAGDVQVEATIDSRDPGATESLTFAVKDLVGGSAGVLPTEENPMAGAVQMSPFPEAFNVNARLRHTTARSQDTFTVESSTPTRVDAVIDQKTTTTEKKSNRRFTATVDKLPTKVTVDLVREGDDKQTIDYTGSAPIGLVRASDTTTTDVSQPGSYTESVYEVKGVPTEVGVDLLGGSEDITYNANGNVAEASFQTQTFSQANGLESKIAAKAHQIPKQVHVTNLSNAAGQKVTYDADSELQDVILEMFDAKSDTTEDDAIDLRAKATGIPTHLDFTETKATGAYDFNAPGGIDLIEATLTLGGGEVLPMPGTDHATVYKRDAEVGLDFRLSGFESAHFSGEDETNVALGLNPGGQSFDAIADVIDTETDLDVLAQAHVNQLPEDMAVTISPDGESATYTASSVIPQILASVEKRDTGDRLGAEILDVPTSIALQFDADGSTIDWTASGTTGKVAAEALLTPDSIGGDRNFKAGLTIESIASKWNASWADGNVLFNVPSPGSIGKIAAKVTNHGTYHELAGDHVSAFFDEASGDLDASLTISDLRKASFTKLTNAGPGGFEAKLNMGNNSAFNFAADVTLDTTKLKALGNFDNLPSEVTLRSDGGRITYNGNTNPDLTVSVEAGAPAAIAATPNPSFVHGVAVRDGASGTDKAVKAKLFMTGLPKALDLNSPAGTYEVTGYHPSISTLVVDAKLTTLAAQPLTLLLTQVVPTASPVNFKFGPFLTSTAANGTHNLSLTYTSNQDLGKLTANATYGNTDEAQLEISEIPKSIVVTGAFGSSQKIVGVTMNHGISEIKASYKKVGDLNFAAAVKLNDVPSSVNLRLGRDTASAGGKEITAPDFTFTTSAPGLDIDATATAAIATPADIKAAANLQVTNLGQTVTGALQGTSLQITSAPATGSFLLEAAGTIGMDFNLDFSGGGFTNDGELNVDIDVKKLHLGFKNTTSLILDLGITTGLRGDFSNFTFGLDTDTEIHIFDDLDFFIDWPDPFGSSTIHLFDIDEDIDFNNLIQGFHINSNTFGEIFDIPVFFFLIGECTVDFNMRPAPGGTTDGSTLSLGPPPNDGEHTPAWLITPDPQLLGFSLPDFAMDLIAFFASPYGNGFKITSGCHVYDLNPF